MQISVSSTLTVYHDGQFWVGLAEHVEGGRYGVARIVFGAEPSNEEILRFVVNKWAKLSLFGDKATETSKPAKNPKRRAREAAKALKQPAMGTKAQQALANQRETMKRESAQARSRRRADEAEARFEQRKLKRKQKHRGH
ncbi:YjdF family protein [Arcanobacterium phocae]|uniref:YjdF family protein n=1 Tax=Arcanobacterium phocae TaxID=131112 RepID=UPI001C0EEB16|nr:YjdF family protein [Arcanobacterium phocae]